MQFPTLGCLSELYVHKDLQVDGSVGILIKNAEPICAALNIFRLILLRDDKEVITSFGMRNKVGRC